MIGGWEGICDASERSVIDVFNLKADTHTQVMSYRCTHNGVQNESSGSLHGKSDLTFAWNRGALGGNCASGQSAVALEVLAAVFSPCACGGGTFGPRCLRSKLL